MDQDAITGKASAVLILAMLQRIDRGELAKGVQADLRIRSERERNILPLEWRDPRGFMVAHLVVKSEWYKVSGKRLFRRGYVGRATLCGGPASGAQWDRRFDSGAIRFCKHALEELRIVGGPLMTAA